MAKVFIEETTLSAIGDAIRTKTETTELINPADMAEKIEGISVGSAAVVEPLSITSNGTYNAPEGIDGYTPITVNVPQDGAPTAAELTITGDCDYRFANNGWDWFVKKYGNQITTNNINSCSHMFFKYGLKEIPFEINIRNDNNYTIDFDYMFDGSTTLETIPKINCLNCYKYGTMAYMFYNCQRLRYLPEDIEDWFDWSAVDTDTSQYGFTRDHLFEDCFSLRSIPMGFLNHGGSYKSYSYCIYKNGFTDCFNLDEIVDLPNPHYNATWGGGSWYNAFDYTFDNCSRIKRLTFKIPDGAPYVVKWNYQTINLSKNFGWASNTSYITQYNSGITNATRITDDTTYQALKDNPDSWTTDVNYSRYNRTSAVETINSLPDTSAYLATAGGTNTIKFKGAAGALTDGGAINTMTEEEIAVAAAKGWTVSFA